jgi:class 3 adenylate cyclase
VLADFHRLVREVIGRHRGVEVDTEGDGFFVAFAGAREAVEAAAETQAALTEHPLRVRMGLHTGEPLVVDNQYTGIDVHRASRRADAGHGGQVLVSQSTRELLEPSFELLDLGRHRLKDLAEPVRLYQLGPEKFPPVRSLDTTNFARPADTADRAGAGAGLCRPTAARPPSRHADRPRRLGEDEARPPACGRRGR